MSSIAELMRSPDGFKCMRYGCRRRHTTGKKDDAPDTHAMMLTMRADVVILGAGVIGASVAHHLARRGCRNIVLLDRGTGFGAGSTPKSTGGFRAQFDNETEILMSLLSRAKLLAFEEETGVDPGYRPHGYLFLARTEKELDGLRAAQNLQQACGLAEARIVTAAEALSINPAIGDASIVGGAFCPRDGFIQPMNILRGYAQSAERQGAKFIFDTTFHELRVEGHRAVAARTSRGDWEAPIFVNALGAWSGAPVTPLRRNVAATAPTTVLDEAMPMTIWAGDWYHLRVRDGRVLLLWSDDPVVDDDIWLSRVMSMTRERVPLLASVPIEERWSGLYEMTPDGRPIVGQMPDLVNAYVASGCCGHGVMHAPAIGQLVAQMIFEETMSIDPRPLSPERFS